MESVTAACTEALKSKAISKDVILNILQRKSDTVDSEADANIIHLPLKHVPRADCNAYNFLLSGVSA